MAEFCPICREETWRCTCPASRPSSGLSKYGCAHALVALPVAIGMNLAALWAGIWALRYLGLL